MSEAALVGALLAALAADPTVLLEKADAPHDAFGEGLIRLDVSVTESGKPPQRAVLDLYVKGADRSLCVFLDGKQEGRKVLTVGEKVWLIVPTASKPVPVTKSQRLMGAASFGDVAGLRFADAYDARLRPEIEEGSYVLDLIAKKKSAPYPAAVLWIGKDDGLARRLRLALASGKPAKDVRFTKYNEKGQVGTMEIEDLLAGKKRQVTTLRFLAYEKREIDPSLLTPEGARALP